MRGATAERLEPSRPSQDKSRARTVIAEATGIKNQTVHDDIKWLRKNGYLNPDFKFRKRFKPTAETKFFIADLLRKGSTYRAIAEKLGTSPLTLSKFLKKTADPRIQAAMRFRENQRKKKVEQPFIWELHSKRFKEEFGQTPRERSKENMEIFYAEEIKRAMEEGIQAVEPSIRDCLYKYNLIPRPKNYKWKKGRG